MDKVRKQFLDDHFDSLSLLAGGNYVSMYDVEEKVTRYSPGAVELFGLSGEYVEDAASDWTERIHPEDLRRHQKELNSIITCQKLTYDLNYRIRISDGNYGFFRLKGAVIRDMEGKPCLIGGVMYNEGLTEYTDAVTALRNRMGFLNDLGAMQAMHQESVILLIGIKRMSSINAEYGYGYGNKLLQRIAFLIQDCVGNNGIVYRMDGSRFAVMSQGIEISDAQEIYIRIRRELQRGIVVDDIKHNLICGGGLIVVDDFDVNETVIYTCLNYAYKESKRKGRGTLVSFSGSMEPGKMKNLSMINNIRNCMVNDCENFYLLYQPVIKFPEGKAFGVETLVRFENEEYGKVMPSEFLPALEQDFAFEEMGIWIMKNAMKDGVRLLEKNKDFVLGLNVSASEFEDEMFVENIKEASALSGFPLKNVFLELSRDCRMLNWDVLIERINTVKSLGIKILLDDFGSGYAPLEALKQLPIDYVKFDMQFVKGILEDEIAREDLRRLSELASIHGVTACVKGIESKEMQDIIKELNVSGGQGMFYEEPVTLDVIMEKYM